MERYPNAASFSRSSSGSWNVRHGSPFSATRAAVVLLPGLAFEREPVLRVPAAQHDMGTESQQPRLHKITGISRDLFKSGRLQQLQDYRVRQDPRRGVDQLVRGAERCRSCCSQTPRWAVHK